MCELLRAWLRLTAYVHPFFYNDFFFPLGLPYWHNASQPFARLLGRCGYLVELNQGLPILTHASESNRPSSAMAATLKLLPFQVPKLYFKFSLATAACANSPVPLRVQ